MDGLLRGEVLPLKMRWLKHVRACVGKQITFRNSPPAEGSAPVVGRRGLEECGALGGGSFLSGLLT